jgi:poly(3-hydroxybutyrate) depolymerase
MSACGLLRAMRTSLCLLLVVACGGPSDPPGDPPGPDAGEVPGEMPTLPAVTGTCPDLVDGDVLFAPAGMPARRVRLTLPTTAARGPLILYWHATGSAPPEAGYSLGATAATITDAGGIIAAPYSDGAAGTFEWFIVNGSAKPDDFLLADEIVACLAAADRIDPRRIHSMGMSAGALQTTAMSFVRSAYIASVATYSGGMPDGFSPSSQDPENKLAALIFMGGASDNVFGLDFKAASERYLTTLTAAGHFAALCDHGMGHEIPLDAAPSVAEFFAANPYGAWPSPFANGLPASFPSYCES